MTGSDGGWVGVRRGQRRGGLPPTLGSVHSRGVGEAMPLSPQKQFRCGRPRGKFRRRPRSTPVVANKQGQTDVGAETLP